MRGKFFVIDGTDGSGKKTQTLKLIERMKAQGMPVAAAAFPRYGNKSAGLVEEYLAGAYGTAEEVGARRASVFYAVDRYAAAKEINGWLDAGMHVVADRYVASNMGHQGGKISDPAARAEFFKWNDELEYGMFAIPRPDVNIILHVPAETSDKLMDVRGNFKDLHEADINHLRAAERTYVEIASMFPGFQLIECVENNELLSVDQIHEKVWAVVAPMLARQSKHAAAPA